MWCSENLKTSSTTVENNHQNKNHQYNRHMVRSEKHVLRLHLKAPQSAAGTYLWKVFSVRTGLSLSTGIFLSHTPVLWLVALMLTHAHSLNHSLHNRWCDVQTRYIINTCRPRTRLWEKMSLSLFSTWHMSNKKCRYISNHFEDKKNFCQLNL